ISRLSAAELTPMSSPLRWQQLAVTAPILLLVLLGLALSPALSVILAASQRDQVRDQRTHQDWTHRARVNPWEARAVALSGWFGAGWSLLGAVLAATVLQLLQLATALTWAWIGMIVLVLGPLQGLAGASAVRFGLRGVLLRPGGDYLPRERPPAPARPQGGPRAARPEG